MIHLATPADTARLHPLIQRAYRGEASRAGWTHEADLIDGERLSRADLAAIVADPAERVLVAAEDGTVVGCVRVGDRGDGVAELGLLAVEPQRQGSGLGKTLIAAAEALAREAFGAGRMRMTVIDCRAELIAFYRRRGYAVAGRCAFPLPARRPLAMLVLEKPL